MAICIPAPDVSRMFRFSGNRPPNNPGVRKFCVLLFQGLSLVAHRVHFRAPATVSCRADTEKRCWRYIVDRLDGCRSQGSEFRLCFAHLNGPHSLFTQYSRDECPAMLAIVVTSGRDTYADGNGDGEVLMLDIAAGQTILEGELGASKAVFDVRIVVKLIRRRRERDLKRPKRNELDASVAAGGNPVGCIPSFPLEIFACDPMVPARCCDQSN